MPVLRGRAFARVVAVIGRATVKPGRRHVRRHRAGAAAWCAVLAAAALAAGVAPAQAGASWLTGTGTVAPVSGFAPSSLRGSSPGSLPALSSRSVASSWARSVTYSVPTSGFQRSGLALLVTPPPAWDSPSQEPGVTSVVLVSSPEIQGELAAIRVGLLFGLGLIVLLLTAILWSRW